MKRILLISTAMASIVTAHAQGGGKTLVVYFSRSGNTETVAEHIRSFTGADMFRVETVKPYPAGYRETTEAAGEELKSGARPAIKGKVENIGGYDTVFIGFPIWWGTYPMAVATFLDNYNLEGKTVIPFCTHEGSGRGESFADIGKAAPGSFHKDGFSVRGSQAAGSKDKVEEWLREIEVIE